MGLEKIVQKTPKFYMWIENSIPGFQTQPIVDLKIKLMIFDFVKSSEGVSLGRWIKGLRMQKTIVLLNIGIN